MSKSEAVTSIDGAIEQHGLRKIASGKVREIYEIDDKTLLFVATDRISAYDVIMKNGVPGKGSLLTLMTEHWFNLFKSKIPQLETHLLSVGAPSTLQILAADRALLRHRSMVVRRLKIFPIESIVRGYITGSGWAEYKRSGTVHGISMPTGLQESQQLDTPLWTPSTKAELGDKDENITPQKAREIVGEKYASQIEAFSIQAYKVARDYAAEKGIIIADTKFEFGLDEATDTVVLVDEVLTPDSSRFWPADRYGVGRGQDSYDKQFLRDWLTREGLKGKEGVEMPADIVERTADKYREAFEKLTGRTWEEALRQ